MPVDEGAHSVLKDTACRIQKMLAIHGACYEIFEVTQEIAEKGAQRDDEGCEPVWRRLAGRRG